MKQRKPVFRLNGDVERPHPTVADSVGDGLGAEPLTVRLGDLWSDFVKAADQARDPEASRESRNQGAVPLLDDMKGILQWD
jgi:hypothetical protein